MWIRPFRKVPVVSTTRPARDPLAVAEHDAGDLPGASSEQILRGTLGDVEVRRLGQQFGDCAAIQLAIGLSARTAHRRPLAAVEDAELDAGTVDGAAHDAVERIDLAHQMPFAEPADRRVARHLADRRALVGQQQGAGAHAGRRRRRFASGMPAADHDDVPAARRKAHGRGMYEAARLVSRFHVKHFGDGLAEIISACG